MPSQEDYLDQLLKGIEDEPVPEDVNAEEFIGEESVIQEPVFEMPESADTVAEDISVPDLDFVGLDSDEDILKKMVLENATIEDVLTDEDEDDAADFMSEDEIEQILAANKEETANPEDDILGSEADEDLMNLLEESSDGELQDIYDMLHKADNNEAVDEELFALLQGDSEVDEASKLQAVLDGAEEATETEGSALSDREQKALEKKRLKEEKAAAKRAAKEAKKAEKEAQRAAKKAAKETAKENVQSAAISNEAAEADVFEGIDELSSTDMMDLQNLLSVGEAQSSSEDATEQLQQDAQPQSVSVAPTMPENIATPTAAGADESMSADMLEIDELLSLAGISGTSEIGATEGETLDTATEALLVDENEIQELIPEKEKKGLFTRILDFLTETDEDEEEEKGTEDIPLSDENRNILEEMDKEGKNSGKKKTKKEKKGKKGKKAQGESETMEEDDEEAASKNKKPKKPKKPKKEKPVKVVPLDEPKSKISVKTIIPIAAVCASILGVILLLVNLGGDFAAKREAKEAYYNEDYETCYQSLYGKNLNESEQVMFAKSESILRINLRLREYEMFAEEKSEVEALDVLIQTVHDYADLYEYASKWNAGEDVAAVYTQMLGILQDKYNLTEGDALEIAAEPDDVEYTKIVTAVAEGKAYGSSNEEPVKPENLPDMLPEELKFPENNGGQ